MVSIIDEKRRVVYQLDKYGSLSAFSLEGSMSSLEWGRNFDSSRLRGANLENLIDGDGELYFSTTYQIGAISKDTGAITWVQDHELELKNPTLVHLHGILYLFDENGSRVSYYKNVRTQVGRVQGHIPEREIPMPNFVLRAE